MQKTIKTLPLTRTMSLTFDNKFNGDKMCSYVIRPIFFILDS